MLKPVLAHRGAELQPLATSGGLEGRASPSPGLSWDGATHSLHGSIYREMVFASAPEQCHNSPYSVLPSPTGGGVAHGVCEGYTLKG